MFPHHENELAQGTCCTDHSEGYARYWVHNAMLDIEGEKMSKSLGNFIVLRDMLQQQPHELVRLTLLSAHYRSNMNWSEQLLHQSRSLLDRLYTIKNECLGSNLQIPQIKQTEFFTMLLDDLNTPKAYAVLHELTNQYFKAEAETKQSIAAEISSICDFMNVAQLEPKEWFQGQTSEGAISADAVEALIAERTAAKKDRNFARADEIREELSAQGVQIKDTRDGTTWQREG